MYAYKLSVHQENRDTIRIKYMNVSPISKSFSFKYQYIIDSSNVHALLKTRSV